MGFSVTSFEIRAKLPLSVGMWPAFWTLGTSRSEVGWPACGEIDVMECWGHTPRSVTSCVHSQKDRKHQSDFGKIESKQPLEDFHVYAMEWFPDRMDFFFDGQKYHTVPLSKLHDKGDNAFRKAHPILLNLALEGRGKKVDEQGLPQRLVVDYVSVYRQTSQ
jgi:beta-glucanase (GH16 family)